MTLRDIMIVFKACHDRRLFEHDQRAWLAHTTAFLTAYAPQKSREFPKLKIIESKKPEAPPAAATKSDWRAMLDKARAWVKGKS
ncbi:hypothetical protein ACQZ61_04085 [Agrobacterium vitis]|uniref:hypothetical protein n=1 Tax=Agrobacterium vitis TaxID=373 RepID=UPI001F34EF21|nr:hypothetical protein [Agrobacterium vitis]MCF1452297.1 hypothetical protein [Agrobacterium vitis]